MKRASLGELHQEAKRLAFAWYLRKGRVPKQVERILRATASPEAFDEYGKFNPDQLRAPAGTPEGGQWIDAGGSEDGGISDPPLKPVYPVETLLSLFVGSSAVTSALRALTAARIGWGLLRDSGKVEVEKTFHGAQRFYERGFNESEIETAINTAKEGGGVVTRIGKYGTVQKVYTSANGITVVVETEGRNAGKVITLFRRSKGGYNAYFIG